MALGIGNAGRRSGGAIPTVPTTLVNGSPRTSAKVGDALTVFFPPKGLTAPTQQARRNTTAISGATGHLYTTVAADAETSLTFTGTGLDGAAYTTAAVTVAALVVEGITITASDGTTPGIVDNGDGTYDIYSDGVLVGTITQAQIDAGGFIVVVAPVAAISGANVIEQSAGYVIHVGPEIIEDNISVQSNNVEISASLPFDISSEPAVTSIVVVYSYAAGADTLEITSVARAETVYAPNILNSPKTTASRTTLTYTGAATSGMMIATYFEVITTNFGRILSNQVTGGASRGSYLSAAGSDPGRLVFDFEHLTAADAVTWTNAGTDTNNPIAVGNVVAAFATFQAGSFLRTYHSVNGGPLLAGETKAIAAGAKFLTDQIITTFARTNGTNSGDIYPANVSVYPMGGAVPDIPALAAAGSLYDSAGKPRSPSDLNSALGYLPIFSQDLNAADTNAGKHSGTFGNTVSGSTITPVAGVTAVTGTFQDKV